MPYKAVKVPGQNGYIVTTVAGPHKGHKHEKKPISKAKALAQIRAIGMHSHGR